MESEIILILDFGSQFTHLIKTELAKRSIQSKIRPGDIDLERFKKNNPQTVIQGVILTGGSRSVHKEEINFDKKWTESNFPVLGICYGVNFLKGFDFDWTNLKYEEEKINFKKETQFSKNISENIEVLMAREVGSLLIPEKYSVTADSSSGWAIAENKKDKHYAVRFHPEVADTEKGGQILENFCLEICGIKKGKGWTPERFFKETKRKYLNVVGDEKIIFGLSGGVDSMTMAALLRKMFPPEQLRAVYIDSGLMPDKTMGEVEEFCRQYDIPLTIKDSADVFFKNLKGVQDPSEKGKAIGRVFIREFEGVAKKYDAEYFAQGTIWSDVIESGVTKFSSEIKPHHNVGGLPEKMNFNLIEPFRELFKNQVREIANYLKLPKKIVNKKVFPGPGFAIRVDGEVTRQKVSFVRKCTEIVEDVIFNSDINDDIWMAFAILANVSSLGIKDGERVENDQAIVIRIVESDDSMTVKFSRKAYPCLEEISQRIVNETSIKRVVYDITDKPPATIEWQ